MNPIPFFGREREIALLENLWKSQKAELLILYGRRRVGKTRLLTHWLQSNGHRALFWVGSPTSQADQLRSFSQTLYNFANPGLPAPENFTYASWAQVFQQIANLAQTERLAVIIDEFTYLLAVDSGIAGLLQNTWDHLLKNANIFLAISGSQIGMMERNFLSYEAPLYGRATALLKLLPMPFANTQDFFPAYRPDERVAVYAMLGGVPAYWERFNPEVSIDQNIREQFLQTNNLLQDEPRLLLQDFVSEPHNYVAILRAIAYGNRTPKDISGYTGLADKHVPAYLAKLIDTGFIERQIPITVRPSSRSGRHRITDPFLRFYFRFLSRRQAQLALGIQDQALQEIKRHLLDFIGANTWEELCQEWMLRASANQKLPFLPDQIGSAWSKRAQVDVVGINSMEKTLLLGECKWSPQLIGRAVLEELVRKTEEMIPAKGKWKVYYFGFARAGWTPEAHQFANDLESQGLKGETWQATGMKLLDLNQVDQDLADWTD